MVGWLVDTWQVFVDVASTLFAVNVLVYSVAVLQFSQLVVELVDCCLVLAGWLVSWLVGWWSVGLVG